MFGASPVISELKDIKGLSPLFIARTNSLAFFFFCKIVFALSPPLINFLYVSSPMALLIFFSVVGSLTSSLEDFVTSPNFSIRSDK